MPSRRHQTSPLAHAAIACTILALSACAARTSPDTGRGLPPSDQPAIEPAPSDPQSADTDPAPSPPAASGASLLIHPLTRFGKDSAGDPAIILHLELRDAFDQSIKAPGIVRVDLDGLPGPGRSWTIDLRDPAQNALMFDDLVTRTYTIPLGGVPDSLIAWSNEDSRADSPIIRVRWSSMTNRARELKAEESLRR